MAAAVTLLGSIAFAGSVVGFMHVLDTERARFLFFFFAGTTFFLLRDRVPMRGDVALACAVACVAAGLGTTNHALHRLVLAGTLPYVVMWLSFVPGGLIRRYNRLGDYSYGTYILAGPVQVLLVQRLDHNPPLLNLAYTMLLVIPLAALSWHLVESRALALKLPRLLEPLAAHTAASPRK